MFHDTAWPAMPPKFVFKNSKKTSGSASAKSSAASLRASKLFPKAGATASKAESEAPVEMNFLKYINQADQSHCSRNPCGRLAGARPSLLMKTVLKPTTQWWPAGPRAGGFLCMWQGPVLCRWGATISSDGSRAPVVQRPAEDTPTADFLQLLMDRPTAGRSTLCNSARLLPGPSTDLLAAIAPDHLAPKAPDGKVHF